MNELDDINASYLISIRCEEHFKPMMDEYLSKVLINGATVPLKELIEYQKIKDKVYISIYYKGY